MVRSTRSGLDPAGGALTGRTVPASRGPAPRRAGTGHLDVVQRYLNYVVASQQAGAAPKPGPHGGPAAGERVPQRPARFPAVVADVMTRTVVSVPEDASFKDIVVKLTRHHVASLPVVDPDGVVLGVISESDLLAKLAGEDAAVPSGQHRSELRRRVHATTAGDLMTRPAVTTTPDTPIAEAARVTARRRVRRLPVVDRAGRLLGIVSRADLLRPFLRPDTEIRQDILDLVIHRRMGLDPSVLTLTVCDGVVSVAGSIESQPVMENLLHQIHQIAGVVGIRNDLCIRP